MRVRIQHLFKKHESRPTNPKIADVFYEMGPIEQWRSGIDMISGECKAAGLPEPEYSVVREGIEVTFRLPEKKDQMISAIDLPERESKIYAVICKGDSSTAAEISELTGVPLKTTRRTVVKLVEKGYAERVG